MRLYLLRHGQTPANVLGQLDTAVPGAPLTERGAAQARAVVAGVSGLELGSLFVSTLLRTQQTAAPLAAARGLTPTVVDGFREITAGSLEMLDDPHSQGVYNATAFAWARGDLDLRMPGGESGHEFFARFDAAITAVVTAHADARLEGEPLIVSHGAAIRTWVAWRATNIDGSFAGDHTLDNTGLVTLESVDPGRIWKLIEWHFEPIGGAALGDPTAIDPTGELLEAKTQENASRGKAGSR